MSLNPNALTIARLKEEGYEPHNVEYRDRFGRTHDLLGIGDFMGLCEKDKVLIQCTVGIQNHHARVRKVLAALVTRSWLASGDRIEVWSWRQLKNEVKFHATHIRLDSEGRLEALTNGELTKL